MLEASRVGVAELGRLVAAGLVGKMDAVRSLGPGGGASTPLR